MIGFPKVFSTKKDFYNAVKLYPKETRDKLRQLMADRYIWVPIKNLKNDEEGITDNTHKVVTAYADDSESNTLPTPSVVTRTQMKLVLNPTSEFNELGWTLQEANIFLVD